MTKFATTSLNYYFYEESDDKEGMFSVFYGNNESQFMAAFVAEFNNEEDANEYVDWKNEQLEEQDGNLVLDASDFDEDEEVLPEDLVGLVTRMDKDFD